jgi:valyl-tRNA synthetase
MNEHAGKFAGLYVKQARKAVVEEMQVKGLIEKIDETYIHRVGLCYKCKTVLEPLPLEQWYLKIKPLAEKGLKAISGKEIEIYPKNFTPVLESWYNNLRDWNISRQNVWGIQIPVWYEVEDPSLFTVTFIDSANGLQSGKLSDLLKKGISQAEITAGLQRVVADISAKVVFEEDRVEGRSYLPETDTFDTWFSSAQWPYVTLQTTQKGDFDKFYPTNVMETGRDILFFWVSRMIMMGLFKEELIPFKDVILHGIVNDPLGKKMSKSKGNVVNPLEVADEYAEHIKDKLVEFMTVDVYKIGNKVPLVADAHIDTKYSK